MQIIINDIEDVSDMLAALSAVTATLCDPSAWYVEQHVFTKQRRDHPPSQQADRTGPDMQLVAIQVDDAMGSRRLMPCPRRGTHRRLTDCWMCWSDVHRAAVGPSTSEPQTP